MYFRGFRTRKTELLGLLTFLTVGLSSCGQDAALDDERSECCEEVRSSANPSEIEGDELFGDDDAHSILPQRPKEDDVSSPRMVVGAYIVYCHWFEGEDSRRARCRVRHYKNAKKLQLEQAERPLAERLPIEVENAFPTNPRISIELDLPPKTVGDEFAHLEVWREFIDSLPQACEDGELMASVSLEEDGKARDNRKLYFYDEDASEEVSGYRLCFYNGNHQLVFTPLVLR